MEGTMTESLTYEDLALPNYVNSKPVFAGLTVSDLPKAAVLGGLNLMLVGNAGTGKTQLASDISQHYFGGNKAEGGHSVFMKANPDIDVYNEIFTELRIERARRELTDSIGALMFFVDELNRAPPVSQNQFFGLADKKMDYKGRAITLGKKGYNILVATANMGNGEFSGTFEPDKALLNRLHVALDLEHGPFQPTYQDRQHIRERKANPNVLSAPPRDLSNKIISAFEEIEQRTMDPGLETLAVLDYLETGLLNCQRYGMKDRVWPMGCQDCEHNKDANALCSMIAAPVTRTMEVVRKYATALSYLAKLKDPTIEVEPDDLVFKAFELTGAY